MKSKKLMSKVSILTLAGLTVLGSGSSLFAKSHRRPVNCRPNVTRPNWD